MTPPQDEPVRENLKDQLALNQDIKKINKLIEDGVITFDELVEAINNYVEEERL